MNNDQLCECGSKNHESSSYRLCPLNPLNKTTNVQKNQCRCGSYSHQRTNYTHCRLNKRFIQNSMANTIQSLDDVNDVIQSEVQLSVAPPIFSEV